MAGVSLSALAPKLLHVAQSTAAGGLAGGAALVIVMVAQAYGVTISPDAAGAIVGGAVWLVVHLTPDTLKDHVKALASKLNVSSKTVAEQLLAIVPTSEAVTTSPSGRNGQMDQPPFADANVKS